MADIRESYLQDLQYKGKTLEQWIKAFNGEFTPEAMLNMIRAGADLEKMLVMGLDETEELTADEGLPGEEDAVLEDTRDPTPEDEEAALNESMSDDCVTVRDFKKSLSRSLANDADKIMFRDMDKKAYEVFDMHGKGGVFVVDLVPAMANEEDATLDESITPKWIVDVKVMGMNLAFTRAEDTEKEATESVKAEIKKLSNGSNPKVEIISVKPMKQVEASLDTSVSEREQSMSEGYNWKTGGYGGYGRTYKSYGEVGAPRGKAISWFKVSDLDPKAVGKMLEWRVGPSNFPFEDLLYPQRKYKTGTTVLRSKYVNAGTESGVKYIAVPSYLDAVRNNDMDAIGILDSLGVPLDLTFGYGPDEDFSSTYTVKQ